MNILSFNTRLEFFKYLNGELSLPLFEAFITQNIYLEQELGTDLYIELLTFDYKDKNACNRLENFIFDNLVSAAEFETWKLTERLQSFY